MKRKVKERGYTAPVLLGESAEVTGVRYGTWGPPTVYLIGRQGRLLARGAGPRVWSRPRARRLMEEGTRVRSLMGWAART